MRSTHTVSLVLLLAARAAWAQPMPSGGELSPAAASSTLRVEQGPPTQVIESPGFTLRPIDRATVRIFGVMGLGARFGRGRSGSLRLLAAPEVSFGSGVVISAEGVVLTARHVLEGADRVVVVFPGQRVAVPATPIFSDVTHDIAFLQVMTQRPISDHVALPERAAAPLTSGQRVFASGYPLTADERYPAAASGEFARMNNDGRMQLSISVNHGNSGGPVLDEAGRLLGVVSMRGEPERGVEGLSLVEPIEHASAAWQREGRSVERPTFTDDDARVAQGFYDLIQLDPEHDDRDAVRTQRVLSLAHASLRPEEMALVGALAWNEALLELDVSRVSAPADLPADRRRHAEALLGVASDLTTRSLREAPYLGANYGFLYLYARIRGAVVAPAPTPERDSERAAGERAAP